MPKKRIILIGILLAFCLAGQWLLHPSQATADSAENQNLPPLQISKSGQQQNSDALHQQLIRQLITMTGIVALFGVGLWWFARRYSRGLMGGRGKLVSVIETVPLGPRKMVHILQVGSRKLLLGSTADSIRFLADLTDTDDLSSPQGSPKGDKA